MPSVCWFRLEELLLLKCNLKIMSTCLLKMKRVQTIVVRTPLTRGDYALRNLRV